MEPQGSVKGIYDSPPDIPAWRSALYLVMVRRFAGWGFQDLWS